MDTLDRFLVKEFLIFFALVLMALSSLYLGIDFLHKFWKTDVELSTTFILYLYKVPATLQQFVPVGCLMATLLVLTSMSRQNEILALYAGGVSLVRITSTMIAVVSVVCTVSFLTFDKLTPLFQKKHILLSKGLDPNDDQLLSTRQGQFWYRNGKLLYRVGRFNSDTNTLEDLNIYLLASNSSLIQRIRAQSAQYRNNDWLLRKGFVVTYPQDTHFPISSTFETKSGVIPEKPGDFKSFEILEETMELRDLRRFIDRNRSYGLDTTAQQVNYHERLALVFAPLIFVLLGVPFATNPLKTHSMAKSVGLCFFLVFVYLLTFRFSLSLGKGGHVQPAIAGWTPNFIFLICALFAIFKKKDAA